MISLIAWYVYTRVMWAILLTIAVGIIGFIVYCLFDKPRCPIHKKTLKWSGYTVWECPVKGCKYYED
jgi:hypothetical protein